MQSLERFPLVRRGIGSKRFLADMCELERRFENRKSKQTDGVCANMGLLPIGMKTCGRKDPMPDYRLGS